MQTKQRIRVRIPHKYEPRPYQRPFWEAFDKGIRKLVLLWHRRAGKDKTCFNLMVREAMSRVGIYYYFFPTYAQGRKILWEGVDKAGFRFLDHIPAELLDGKPNDTEMKIKLINGSLIRVIGTDRYDDIVGTNPVGCVFSEYALQNPAAWDLIRPILLENKGWVVFPYTPRGNNHGKRLFDMAQGNPEWFAQSLSIKDTGTITPEEVENEVRAGMDKDLAEQEFYCSFEGAMQGAYYSKQLKEAKIEGRITQVPYDKELTVNTFWDLGVGDSTAIWFIQEHLETYRVIDYYEASGEGLSHYIKVLQDKGYIYNQHFAPHDIRVRELGTGKSRLEVAEGLGIRFDVAPQMAVEDGIDAVRRVLNQCWFDKDKCDKGIDALLNYSKDYDEVRKEYSLKPLHNWSSHGSDAFRMFAVSTTKISAGISAEMYKYSRALRNCPSIYK